MERNCLYQEQRAKVCRRKDLALLWALEEITRLVPVAEIIISKLLLRRNSQISSSFILKQILRCLFYSLLNSVCILSQIKFFIQPHYQIKTKYTKVELFTTSSFNTECHTRIKHFCTNYWGCERKSPNRSLGHGYAPSRWRE